MDLENSNPNPISSPKPGNQMVVENDDDEGEFIDPNLVHYKFEHPITSIENYIQVQTSPFSYLPCVPNNYSTQKALGLAEPPNPLKLGELPEELQNIKGLWGLTF